MNPIRTLPVLSFLVGSLFAQIPAGDATVTGVVVDPAVGRGIEFATVTLKNKATGAVVRAGATDAKGAFALEKIPAGEYQLIYGTLGAELVEAPAVIVAAAHPAVNVGRLPLAISIIKMERMEVTAKQSEFLNSIDRKVYNVGKEILSTTGAASDLLQNIPSVQVDVEGNVSLRGNDNVLILINGKTSALMSATNRADMLAQMPADSIEKIEVITNPSAKYKPDGTSGIINITLKGKMETGSSGVLRASVGNDSRYNLGLTGSRLSGKYHVFGMASLRQDDRVGHSEINRSHLDSATNSMVSTRQTTLESMRPLSRLAQAGVDYTVDDANKLGVTGSYNLRTFFRTSTLTSSSRDARGQVTGDYDRRRTDPEWQKTLSFNAHYHHDFAADGRELTLELKRERHWEHEDNHYSNVFRAPLTPDSQDYTLMMPNETGTEFTAEYLHPLAKDARLEAGYAHETNTEDTDFSSGFFEPATARWLLDTTRTNRFIYRDTIDALYLTFGRPVGHFGFLAGVRLEQTGIDTNQVTARRTDSDSYFRFYPTLHLTYNLTDFHQLQLNYSRRVHRPDGEALNPFPEYQDPYNLRAGNPRLRPEDTHSLESGFQYRKNDTTYLASVYYRDTFHGFTTVTRYLDTTTLLTTRENLATNRSGGVELAATTEIGLAAINLSANLYRNQIDASNLGFSSSRSANAWSAKLNVDLHASKAMLVQLNTNYSAARLTPQGERSPMFVANVGLRREFKDKKTSFVLTVSDLFNTLRERSVIDTPTLHDDSSRRRSSRLIFLGIVKNFGQPGKKPKDDSMKFDNSL